MKTFFNFFFGTLGVVLALVVCLKVYQHWDSRAVEQFFRKTAAEAGAAGQEVKKQAAEVVEAGRQHLEKR